MNSVEDREAAILAELIAILREVVNEDWIEDAQIDMDTTFNSDLTIESIELVNIAERVRNRYPETDIPGWISEMELSQLMELKVGDFVRYIASCQS